MNRKIIIQLDVESVAENKALDRIFRDILRPGKLRFDYNLPNAKISNIEIIESEDVVDVKCVDHINHNSTFDSLDEYLKENKHEK